MKRVIPLFLLIVIFNTCCFGQKKQSKIPRTRVSISIPDGYSLMPATTGLQKDDKQGIIIMDLVGGNYYTNAKDFNKRTFELQGIKVFSCEETKVDGYPAKIMLGSTDDKNYNSISLVFGDTTFSTMISSIHKANDQALETSLKETILSVKYNKEIVIDPFEGVGFTVDTLSTKFKFGGFSSNMYVFTPIGKNGSTEKSMVILTPTPFDGSLTQEQVSQMAINGLKKHGMYGFKTDSTENCQMDGANALTKIGDCYAGVNHMHHHQLILLKNDLALIIYGMCDHKNEEMKAEISEFCEKIRIKD
ncbi:hypothetical protein [Marinifilum flexuosum]|uniref:hypothetical protein n=1 Tax=Marinifilum flexuosum TaxID=1117708 RepID=UPI002491F838|nr:hypothetical protein [Marinifilum flexuosum]